ncbi:MAG: adenylosuccinate synthase [Candidatus Dadabacteria bacterium]|nr:MAG: adenylosuccinate synthase [Candidatus Dadabacteria bacterium]
MASLVILGVQWGDEGKGKVVDYLAQEADLVVRFQGGDNAGHTIISGGAVYKLHLVPSGILNNRCMVSLGAGVVINPLVFLEELKFLEERGILDLRSRIRVDGRAVLILPFHIAMDKAKERREEGSIGTTCRGIGPAYEDRCARSAIRIADLKSYSKTVERVKRITEEKNKIIKTILGGDEVSFKEVEEWLKIAREEILPLEADVSSLIQQSYQKGQRVLFEGAQGTFLDVFYGTVPYVTSSLTTVGSVLSGAGVSVKYIDKVVGIAKAYCTRVGKGPFPTEVFGSLADELREKGKEFGTTTGRPRRVGWLDLVSLKEALRLNGVNKLAVTKLDVLRGFKTLKVCIGYKINGKKVDYFPYNLEEQENIEPEYVELSGWQEEIEGVSNISDLPGEARKYLEFIEKECGIPIVLISTGAKRSETIKVERVWGA